MKIAQGDSSLDVTPYLTEPGLSQAAMGKVAQVKTEHHHWKQQEQLLHQQLNQLSAMDPVKLQNEIQMLEKQIQDTEGGLAQVDTRKIQAQGKLTEIRTEFETIEVMPPKTIMNSKSFVKDLTFFGHTIII